MPWTFHSSGKRRSMCRYKGGRYKRSKIKNPQSIESQWIADWSECRDSNSGPLEPHSSAMCRNSGTGGTAEKPRLKSQKPWYALIFTPLLYHTAARITTISCGKQKEKAHRFLKSVRFLCAPCSRYKPNILWQFHRSRRVEVLIDFREIHKEKHQARP